MPGPSRKEHLGRPDQLLLLAAINGGDGARESAVRAITDFDEYQAVLVKHNEVDFAKPAAVIAFDRYQSPVLQVSPRELLRGAAYRSGVTSCHIRPP